MIFQIFFFMCLSPLRVLSEYNYTITLFLRKGKNTNVTAFFIPSVTFVTILPTDNMIVSYRSKLLYYRVEYPKHQINTYGYRYHKAQIPHEEKL